MARPVDVSTGTVPQQTGRVLDWLKAQGTQATRDGMARYAIPSQRAFGVAMKDLKALGKQLGVNHELALALWKTGWYEARMMTAFLGDPARTTAAQMDRWCADLDNWAHCDTLCFNLFDRTPHAWDKVKKWSGAAGEFQKRTAFALLWSLALHDKKAPDAPFLQSLTIVAEAADDGRNFVKKAVKMALGAIAHRNSTLRGAVRALAQKLATAEQPAARWVGKETLRDLKAKGD